MATVATNDTPSSNGENDWHILKNPLHGTITMEKNGSFTYSPNSNYYGTDYFLYTISDKFGQSNNATVTLNIKPVLFRIKVKTDNPGSSSDVEFQISVFNNGYNYNYNIDCNNDGKYESTGEDGSYICEYDTAGEYTIAIGGTFPQFQNGYDNEKILSVESWGTQVWKSFEDAFAICTNLILNAPDRPNLSQVTNMNGMFYGASAFNQPIGDWNVSHITTMDGMFLRAVSFNQPLSDWNVSNLTSTQFMFSEATAFNQSLEKWDVSHVTTMDGMFLRAVNFNQPLENWDLSSVQYMNRMFYNTSSFSNQNLSSWNVDNVLDHTDFCTGWGEGNTPPSDWTCD